MIPYHVEQNTGWFQKNRPISKNYNHSAKNPIFEQTMYNSKNHALSCGIMKLKTSVIKRLTLTLVIVKMV